MDDVGRNVRQAFRFERAIFFQTFVFLEALIAAVLGNFSFGRFFAFGAEGQIRRCPFVS